MKYEDLKSKYPEFLALKSYVEIHDGWLGIVDKFLASVTEILPPDGEFRVTEIREKFAVMRLRYHIDNVSKDIKNAISEARILAESRSYYTCDQCGNRGDLREDLDFFTIRCKEHAYDHNQNFLERSAEGHYFLLPDPNTGGGRRYDPDLDDFVPEDVPEFLKSKPE